MHPNTVRALAQVNAKRHIRCEKCNQEFFAGLGTMNSHKKWCGDDPVDRFWRKVDKSPGPDSCWPWTGAGHRDGYGRAHFLGRDKIAIAHRLAYKLSNGDITEGMDVLHYCDNRICCNPAHLWLGTHLDNMLDMCSKGRAFDQKRTDGDQEQ